MKINTFRPFKPFNRLAVSPSRPKQVAVPVGFDWTPPVSVIQSPGGEYSTSYNANDWRPATTLEIWVSMSGSDTTGDGTQAKPYKSVPKAFAVAEVAPDAGVHIRIAAGLYGFDFRWGGQTLDKNLVMTAEGGAAIMSTQRDVTWALQGSGAYYAVRATVDQVYDTANLDEYGNPTRLTLVADEATCAATPGSYAKNAAGVWVNLFDGRVPTNATCRVLLKGLCGRYEVNRKWYIKGMIFEGGREYHPFMARGLAGHAEPIVFEDCVFRFGDADFAANGLRAEGVPLVLAINCQAHGNPGDGFNYHQGVTNGISPKVAEIGCIGYGNGQTDGNNNDQASTLHEDCRALRVGGIGRLNVGQQFADVNTSKSWNLGCTASESTATTPQAKIGFNAANDAEVWLDGCNAGSGAGSLVANAGSNAKIRCRRTVYVQSIGNVSEY